MTKTPTRVSHGAWLVVADARRALILWNRGDFDLLDLVLKDELHAPANPATHEQGADRPGRTDHVGGRSSVAQTDWHAQAETRFAAVVAERLERLLREDRPSAIVIAAAPRFLGDLRREFSPALAAVVSSEIAKDFSHLTVLELEREFAAVPAQ